MRAKRSSEKLFWISKNEKKKDNTVRDPKTGTRGYTWIQTSQVLEAYKELPKSMIFEFIWTLWHIPVEKGPNGLKT